MQAAKEKVSNMAAAAKEKIDIHKAKVEEKAEKKAATTEGEKEAAHERRKAKEAQAKMELHAAKAEHKAQREQAKQARAFGQQQEPLVATQGHHYPTGVPPAAAGADATPAVRPEDQLAATHEVHGHHYEADAMKEAPNPIYPAAGYPPNANLL